MLKNTGFMMSTSTRALMATVGALAAVPVGVSAQQTEPQAETTGGLNTIVVTAQRREESVQDVPIAISAFDAAELKAKQIDEPLDLVDYVPNLYGGSNTGLGTANVYFIRGLGNTESISTFDPPVGTYVDEVYVARQNGNNVAFFDVERIEVLRGPQGTLFGRNTTGGAISVAMRKPRDELGGFIEASYGSFDRIVARGSIDVPLSEQVLSKVTAYFVSDDGYVDNIATGETLNGQDSFGIRGDLRIFPADGITLDLAASYAEDERANVLNYPRNQSPLAFDDSLSGSGDRISNSGISTQRGTGSLLDQLLAGQGLGARNEDLSLQANLEIEAGSGAINLIVGHRQLNQDFIVDFFDGGLGGEQFATGGFAIANDGDHNQTSIELKYTGELFDGFANVVAGLFYFTEDNVTDFADVFTIDLDPTPNVAPLPLLLADRVLSNDLETYAGYAQADLALSEKLTLTLGGRLTYEKKEIDYVDNRDVATLPGGPGSALTSANIIAAGFPLDQSETEFTPRIALAYDWSDDISTFASVTRGFKSGGWNARGTIPGEIVPFGPEKVWNYEVGLRSELFGNVVRFNMTGFYMDVSDLQTPSAFVRPDNSIAFITQNFADLESYGAEIDLTIAPTNELNLFVSLGLQDTSYSAVDPSVAQQAADCLNDPSLGGLGIVAPDCSIADTVRTPDITLAIGGSYEIDLGFASLTPSVNGRHVSSTFTGTSGLPNGREDGYFLVNAGVSLVTYESGISLSLDCRNCFNEAYIVSNLPPTVYISEPRRWTLTLRKDF